MGKVAYSPEVCRALMQRASDPDLELRYRPAHYDGGDALDLQLTTVWPEAQGRGRFRIQKFVGGGFAGQVYRCVVESLELPAQARGPLAVGMTCAVKILIPPTGFSRAFRDALYWLGFQAPFSAQVNAAACRTGLLWQKLCRLAMQVETGVPDAVADVYGWFYDANLGAYGEVREWVEGRTWRLECDDHPRARRHWKTVPLSATGSPEYVAKRRFMHDFVALLHRMGAYELARQYEWSTLKSQPNALKRTGHDDDPAGGLCAVDFRAGLALLPFLPMSPGDIRLIGRGLVRGSLVQFDRADMGKLREYARQHADKCPELVPLARTIEECDAAYRRAMPDITHQGWRLLADGALRRDVRQGLADGLLASGRIDAGFARRLPDRPGVFTLFQTLAVVPLLGRFLRRFWGHAGYRRHTRRQFAEWSYLRRAARARQMALLVAWHRAGRTGASRTRFLADHADSFWVQRFTLGLLPAGLHRILAEPGYVKERLTEWLRFARSFYRDEAFRERWLTNLVEEGHQDGMLRTEERDLILSRIGEPYIVKYLKALAVHFATLPVTHIVQMIVGGIVVLKTLAAGGSWALAGAKFLVVVAIFQVTPISPGSLCRGAYTVYLMIRERNFRSYMVAGPFSFLKYIGYFAFPIQMVATYPVLARFMASYWATNVVHAVPVFGEKGALLEHWVFDALFNIPLAFGRWARPRMRLLLTGWMLAGLALMAALFCKLGAGWPAIRLVNFSMIGITVFVLPRVLFYPLMRGRRT